MLKIGLTGGIGCGKSTLVRIFASRGWHTVESDALVQQLLSQDLAVIDAIRKRWGESMILETGIVNRRGVAGIVFSDENELHWLERLLHPKVRACWTEELTANSDLNCLVEIPLLFEKSLESQFDFTVCIHSPESIVASRMESRGYSREELERRRHKQLPIEEKMHRADYVITNAGSLDFLNEQTSRLIEDLTRRGKKI